MTVSINGVAVTFTSPRAVLEWCHRHGYMIEPTKNGIRVIDSNGSTVFEY